MDGMPSAMFLCVILACELLCRKQAAPISRLMIPPRFSLALSIISAAVNLHDISASPARYVARLQNGAIVEGNTLSDWHAPDSMPKLEMQPLFDPGNSLRWLIDRALAPPSRPESFIELVTGDQLPGTVVDFQTAEDSIYSPRPAHFVVQYSGTNVANLEPQAITLRVDARWVRRIVWQRRADDVYEPRTAFFHEGNQVRFRSIRFAGRTATLLMENGVRRVPYSELAELHLPVAEFWPAYFDELTQLAPDGQRRLLQLETTTGLIVTTSLDRYFPRAVGDVRDVNRWIHRLQPAWSLDAIWVPQGIVWLRRSFPPNEVPLSRVPVLRYEQRCSLGSVHFPLAVNRNVAGGILRSANRESGWGLGVHAFAELEYEFPSVARMFRSEFAIDAAMGDGGCVLPRVLNASAGNSPLYQGPVLVGSGNVVDTGPLSINAPAEGNRRVVLQVDPVMSNRPAGADPFDIRDHANWIDPVVELDVSLLKQQIDSRVARLAPGWRGWDVKLEPGGQWKWVSFFAEAPANLGEYRAAVGVTGNALVLSSNRPLTDDDQWLVIDAVRTQPPGSPCKLAVRIGASMSAEFELPMYDTSRSDYRPIVLPLAGVRSAGMPTTLIEIRQLPTPESVGVMWRTIAIVDQHPLLYRLFEDDMPVVKRQPKPVPGLQSAQLDDQQKIFGARSLKLSAGQSLRLPIKGAIAIRERPQLGEHRFLRFAMRKQGGGGLRITLQQPTERERSAVYEAGANKPADPAVRRLTTEAVRDEWLVVTRDLYGDFGNLDLESLTFEVPDGQGLWMDHVYLARTQNDFELIKVVSPAAK